jgi:hypothetical protein
MRRDPDVFDSIWYLHAPAAGTGNEIDEVMGR